MKKILALLLAFPALAFATPTAVQKDSVSNQLLYSGFKVPSTYTIEVMSGATLQIDSGATFTFPVGSIPWSSVTSTPTTLAGYGITDAQAKNVNLTAISGLVSAANTLPFFTGSGTASLATFTSFGQSLVAASNASGAQTLLSLVPGTNVQAHSSTLDAVAAGTYAGATSITTLGTVSIGTWNATPISLTGNVSGILPSANGGTANAFFTVSGPATSAKTYTFPNASANVLTDNAVVTAAQGGTGVNNGTATETRAGNLTFVGAFGTTITSTNTTSVTLPLTGTLATLAGTETLTNKTVNGFTMTALTTGFSLTAGSSTAKTLTMSSSLTFAGTDGSTLNISGGGTLGTAAFTNTGSYEVPLTFSTGLTRTVNTITVNTSQNIATLSNLTGNGVVQTSGGTGALSINTPTGSGAVVEATAPTIVGGSISALTNLGVRDTSAAFDVVIGATSSTTLTAGRALTFDVTNNSRTIKLTGNTVLNQDVSTLANPTFANTTVTQLALGATTPGILSGTSGALTLTANGTNQSITLAPSGSGGTIIGGTTTAANPSLTFAGDTNTGLYHTSTSQIGLTIGGSSVGLITGTGLNAINLGATTQGTAFVTTLQTSGQVGIFTAPTATIDLNDTNSFTNNVSTQFGVSIQATDAQTSAPTSILAIRPLTVVALLGSTNTQNLTGGPAMTAATFAIQTASGATGTVAETRVLDFNPMSNAAAGVTVTKAVGINLRAATSAGTITNLAGIIAASQTVGTNNTDLEVGSTTITAGNWGIRQDDAYANVLNGATTFNTTVTVTGAATLSNSLAVTGTTTLSSSLSVATTSTLTGNVLIGAGAGTGAGNILSINGDTGAGGGAAFILEQGGGGSQSFVMATGSFLVGGTNRDTYFRAQTGNKEIFQTNGANTALTLDASQNATFANNLTASGTLGITGLSTLTGGINSPGLLLTTTGFSTAPGSIENSAANGMRLQAITGTGNDFSIIQASGTNIVLEIPTGTDNLVVPLGNLTVATGGFTVSTGTTALVGNTSIGAISVGSHLSVFTDSGGTSEFLYGRTSDNLTQILFYNATGATQQGGIQSLSSLGLNIYGIGASAQITFQTGATPTTALTLTSSATGQWGAAQADHFTNLTYASTISVNPALGNVFETTTVNATGSATTNFLNAGTAGQTVTLIIVNDATSGKTMTWGTNLRPASATLVGVASKASTIVFESDGTNFFELSRETGNL